MDINFSLPESVKALIATLYSAGFPTFVVGGAVRNLVMGQDVHDWDFATKAPPEKLLNLLPGSKYENSFGTVLVPHNAHKKDQPLKGPTPSTSATSATSATAATPFEITPFRSEGRYSDNRHPDEIQWAETIEEDLQRRDFTINAMAYDGTHFIDTTGGMEDLQSKLVRAVGDPNKRFEEDALRMLRAVRFAAQLNFTIEPDTLTAITNNAELIRSISWERIHDEFFKILAVPDTNTAADAILTLRSTGLLAKILPELNRCFGVEQESPERHHKTDVGTHLVNTLRYCPSPDPVVRFAALIHDIGKAETRAVDPTTGIVTFHNHEIVGATIANTIAERLRFSKDNRILLTKLVRYHMFSVGENQTDKAIRRFIRRIGKEHIQDALDLRTGDRLGSGTPETSWRTELFKKRLIEVQQKPFEIRDLTISGQDVMQTLNINPSPQVGHILKAIFEKVADGELPNDRDILLPHIKLVKLDEQAVSEREEESELVEEQEHAEDY